MSYKFDEQKHIHTLDGKPLHGVTTILSSWGKPDALVSWAVKTAVDYIEESSPKTQNENGWYQEVSTKTLAEARTAHLKKRDKAGDLGTKVHAALEEKVNQWIAGQPMVFETEDVVQKVISWMQSEGLTPVQSEANLYSRDMWVGGIVDLVAVKDGKYYILDFKTSGTVQTKMFYQMGGYSEMWDEQQDDVCKEIAGVCIIHIPRGKSFNPEKNIYWRYDVEELKEAFKNILTVYKLDSSIQKLVQWGNTSNKTSIKI